MRAQDNYNTPELELAVQCMGACVRAWGRVIGLSMHSLACIIFPLQSSFLVGLGYRILVVIATEVWRGDQMCVIRFC